MDNKKHKLKRMNDLIQFQQSALKIYENLVTSENVSPELFKKIKEEHQAALNKLGHLLQYEGEQVLKLQRPAGPWRAVPRQGHANKDRKNLLSSLKQSEEAGLKELEALLKEEGIPYAIKEIIRMDLLPKQKKHVEKIDHLMAS